MTQLNDRLRTPEQLESYHPFERGQAVTGPRCPSVTCRSTDVYFVRIDADNPGLGWFRCDTADCLMDGDFNAFLTGVRPASTPRPHRFKVGDQVIFRSRWSTDHHGEAVEVIAIDRDGLYTVRIDAHTTAHSVDADNLIAVEAPQSQQDIHRARTAFRRAAMLAGRLDKIADQADRDTVRQDAARALNQAVEYALDARDGLLAERRQDAARTRREATGGAR